MYFRMLHDEASGAMSYLLADLEAREAVLVDPRGADLAVLRALLSEHGLRLRWLLRTHEHDERLPVAERRLQAALARLAAPVIVHKAPTDAVLPFGNEHLQVLATPGHTAQCLSFRWRDRLFCGGLMAADACSFQPLPEQPAALWDSVTSQIFTLPDETILFSGHVRSGRATSTVFEERRWHPWFGTGGRDEFLARVSVLSTGDVPMQPVFDAIH